MSTLWTPGGERPVRREPTPSPGAATGAPAGGASAPPSSAPQSEEELQAQLAELRDQLAHTPAEVVIANHAFGLFELAALHLSLEPPHLDQARLAIDALGALVDGLGDRLGDHSRELSSGLSQLRIAYVQIQGAHQAGSSPEG
jgi:hypothetical protein